MKGSTPSPQGNVAIAAVVSLEFPQIHPEHRMGLNIESGGGGGSFHLFHHCISVETIPLLCGCPERAPSRALTRGGEKHGKLEKRHEKHGNTERDDEKHEKQQGIVNICSFSY